MQDRLFGSWLYCGAVVAFEMGLRSIERVGPLRGMHRCIVGAMGSMRSVF